MAALTDQALQGIRLLTAEENPILCYQQLKLTTSSAGWGHLTSDQKIGEKLDSSLWREMKILALKMDKTAGALLEEAIREFLAKH